MGSKNCEEGRIFLNAQSWAILNGIAEGERAQKTFRSMDQYLFREYGPLLLFPAYQKPHANIGYLSRYAPGLRENGGVYTHAATWAVLATCKMGLGNRAFQVYKSFLPPYRGLEPDLYKTEPYVNPGNSDGPDSPHFGRGGYSWYTGSSAWSFLVALEGILGLAPDWDGLRINPVIPDEWDYFEVARPYQGATYRFIFTRSKDPIKAKLIYLDGRKLEGDLIKPCHDGKEHQVEVYF